ncbi:MAG: energy transducer TonB [Flavobacteriales bacterium]|nr:energy transducer TonB [Flavobacteriales bacterium]
MKNSILLLSVCITSMGLGGLVMAKWNSPVAAHVQPLCDTPAPVAPRPWRPIGPLMPVEPVYDLSSRFMMTVTKERLANARSIADLQLDAEIVPLVSYYSMRVSVLDGQMEDALNADGNSSAFNDAQLGLLRTVGYSKNILITADYQHLNSATGKLEFRQCTPYVTIVPEKAAEYEYGKAALVAYVKENARELALGLEADRLQGGRVTFTVTREGRLANVKLSSSSAHPDYDQRVLQLVSTLPGRWTPATDAQGLPVEQELVFFFGTMGC